MEEAFEMRERFRKHGLAMTNQRRVIYEALLGFHGHPSVEELHAAVRERMPSVSLATVYNNVRAFADSGLIREVGHVHGGMRIDANEHPHLHLICTRCEQVTDVDADPANAAALPQELHGFTVERVSIDVLGVCAACAASQTTLQRQIS